MDVAVTASGVCSVFVFFVGDSAMLFMPLRPVFWHGCWAAVLCRSPVSAAQHAWECTQLAPNASSGFVRTRAVQHSSITDPCAADQRFFARLLCMLESYRPLGRRFL